MPEATQRTRVLLTVPSLAAYTGGPAVTVPGLARALAALGHGVALGTLEVDADTEPGVPVHDLRGDPAAALERACAGAPPEVVHDNGVWLPMHHRLARICKRRGIPRVVGPCGMLEPWAMDHGRWKKRAAWHAYQLRDLRRAAILHARTEQEARNLAALDIGTPIALIENGIDMPPVPPPRPTAADTPRTAVFLSRVHPKKGLLNLVAAWDAVRPAGWTCVIAGPDEGGHTGEVREAVLRAGLEETVQLVGGVYGAEKEELLGGADLFILPTFSENFGVAIAEALVRHVPVITTTGTPWKALKEERCGWWIPPEVQPLAAALREATALDAAARLSMGERGRALVQRLYTWERAGRDMASVYAWIRGLGPRPACVVG